MKFLKDVVIVRPAEQYISDGGIHLIDPIRASNIQPAVVVALGSKCKLDLKPGDLVFVSLYIGTPYEIDTLRVRIYDSVDVLAKQVY